MNIVRRKLEFGAAQSTHGNLASLEIAQRSGLEAYGLGTSAQRFVAGGETRVFGLKLGQADVEFGPLFLEPLGLGHSTWSEDDLEEAERGSGEPEREKKPRTLHTFSLTARPGQNFKISWRNLVKFCIIKYGRVCSDIGENQPGTGERMANDKEFELDDLESFSFDDLSLDDAPTAGEQDPEGVWVKSAPEDVADGVPEDAETAATEDEPASQLGSDDLPEEDFLSSEELAHLDDSFDFVTVEEPQEGEAPMDDEVAFLDTPEAVAAEEAASKGSFDEVSLDDFVSFDETGEPQAQTILAPTMDTPAEEPEDDFPEEFLDIDIDIDDEIDDEVLEVSTPKAKPAAPPPSDNLEAETIDLAEFGDFEEVAPVATTPALDELELPDLDLPEGDMTALSETEEDGFFEEEVFEEAPTTALEPDDPTDMDHILALEEDLTSGIREPDAAAPSSAPASAPPSPDLAAAILGKIEQELSSIKQEISALKEEVTHLRTVPGEVQPVAEAPLAAEASKPSHGGFFDDDEDEAIALTGDELDNILSTAEVSEGEEAGVSLDDDLIETDAEGNLVAPPIPESVELEDDHVTDEEFLAGTALDLNEPDAYDVHTDDQTGGVPESIELEEDLPLGLEEETDDLLTAEDGSASLAEEALSSEPDLDLEVEDGGLLSDEPEALPPFEPEAVSLEPDLMSDTSLTEDIPAAAPDEKLEALGDIAEEPAAAAAEPPLPPAPAVSAAPLAGGLKDELRAVLSYMDKLLASLPDDKIQEFAESEHFEVYKRLFEELGLIE